MKKFFYFLGILVVAFFLSSKEAHADEIQDLMSQYALTGSELSAFEHAETSPAKLRQSAPNEEDIKEMYFRLKNDRVLDKSITYAQYSELAHTPAPMDPVAKKFRSEPGRPQAGDILITNGTSFKGFTGHAGIFLGDGNILSIVGIGHKPKVMSVIEWIERYLDRKGSWIKFYRPDAKYNPSKAEEWAVKNYKNKNYKYKITTKIMSKNPTYCSKIVWQAYYNASKAAQKGELKKPSIALPYSLPKYFKTTPMHIATWSV